MDDVTKVVTFTVKSSIKPKMKWLLLLACLIKSDWLLSKCVRTELVENYKG